MAIFDKIRNKVKKLEKENEELEGLKFPKMTDPNKDRNAFHDELSKLFDKETTKQMNDYGDKMFNSLMKSIYNK